jgi:hypothetical protein
MTQVQALDAIDRALAASHGKGSSREEQDIALVTVETLQGVRVGLADLVKLSSASP